MAAKAAAIAAEHALGELLASLEGAFSRFMRDPVKADARCAAKEALIGALDELGHAGPEPFWTGLRHVQIEPVYGGREDSAARLRGQSALALARRGHPEAASELARLLFDPWPEARAGALRAVAEMGGRDAELLLRAKLHAGDAEPTVLADGCRVLLQLAPESASALRIVTEQLDPTRSAERFAQVALALGESRHPKAFETLEQAWDRAIGDEERRRALLLPMALLRSEQALAFVEEVADELPGSLGRAAAEALRSVGVRP